MEYKWEEIELQVAWETHDPGVVHHDYTCITVKRNDMHEGQHLPYDDPSGTLAAVTLMSMDARGVVLSVRGSLQRLNAGESAILDRSGANYTEFRLFACLPLSEAALCSTEGIRYPYEIFRMGDHKIEALKRSLEPEAKYLLGMWYYLYNPDDLAYGNAEELLKQASVEGVADAWMGLANMYYDGTSGKLDMQEYVRLRDKGVVAGSEWARINQIEDLFFGIRCDADRKGALNDAKSLLAEKAPNTARFLEEDALHYRWHEEALAAFSRLDDLKKVDARIYVALGKMYYMMDETARSMASYRMAVAADYVDAYRYLEISEDMLRMGRKAKSSSVICHEGEVELLSLKQGDPYANFVMENKTGFFLKEAENKLNQGKMWLEEALKLGEARAALLLGNLYRDGTIVSDKEFDKAWNYYYRGFQLRDAESSRMCALMIDCGEKNDDPHSVGYYLGWADRFGV